MPLLYVILDKIYRCKNMPLEILKQINWIDIFVVIILLRICYISIKNGMPLEFFKLLGIFTAAYLSLHYYVSLAVFFNECLPKNIPEGLVGFTAFIILAALGYLIWVLLRQVFFKFVKVEPVPKLNKWAGIIFGVSRGFLFLSLIFFAFVISPLPYLKNSVKYSYSGKFIFKIAPRTYGIIWSSLVSKFTAGEKFNDAILYTQTDLTHTEK